MFFTFRHHVLTLFNEMFYNFSADALVASIIGNAEASTSRPTIKREHSQSDDENVKKAKIEEEEDIEEDIVENENIDDKQAIKLVESAPRITIHTLDTPESCTHEVAVPPGHEFEALKPATGEPAKEYRSLSMRPSKGSRCKASGRS